MTKNDRITCEGDLVLIYHQDKPSVFARIESVEPDIKKGWFQVTLLFLTIPTHVVTWILRDSYIDGEPFTMGGDRMRLERVEKVVPEKTRSGSANGTDEKSGGRPGTVIPFKKP
jgi:hypothetical protein